MQGAETSIISPFKINGVQHIYVSLPKSECETQHQSYFQDGQSGITIDDDLVTTETEIGAANWVGNREGIAFDQFNALNPIEKKQFLQLSAIRDACKAQYSIDRMNMSLADVNLIPTDILDTADDPLCRLVEFKADVKEAERVPHFARILNEWDKHFKADDNTLFDRAILLFAQTCGVKDVFTPAVSIDGRQEVLNEDELVNALSEAYIWDGVFLRELCVNDV